MWGDAPTSAPPKKCNRARGGSSRDGGRSTQFPWSSSHPPIAPAIISSRNLLFKFSLEFSVGLLSDDDDDDDAGEDDDDDDAVAVDAMCTPQPFLRETNRVSKEEDGEETGKLLEKDVTEAKNKDFTTNKNSIVVAPFMILAIV